MHGPIVALAVLLGGLVAAAASANEVQTVVHPEAVEVTDELRDLSTETVQAGARRDRHLAVSHFFALDRFDPRRGRLRRVHIEVTIVLEQGFSGLVGGDAPLNEEPDWVATRAGLATRLDLVGPDGAYLHAETVPSEIVACAGPGVCAFSHAERRSFELSLTASPRGFEGWRSPRLIIRATSIGAPFGQLCDGSGAYDSCHLRRARIGFAVPENGIKVTYEYTPNVVGDRSARPPASGGNLLTRTARHVFWFMP